MKKKKWWPPVALLVMDGILLLLGRHVDGFADGYAKWVYPIWVNTLGRVMGIFPFSVIEWLFIVVGVGVILWIAFLLGMRLQKKKKRYVVAKKGLLFLWWFVAYLCTSYTLFCGINLYRTPIVKSLGYERQSFSKEEVVKVAIKEEARLEELSGKVSRDEQGHFYMSQQKIRREARKNMAQLENVFPLLKGYYPMAKPLVFSDFLSYQQLTGMYSVFTIEANYNKDMPVYNIPFTICHELSHLKGVMREDEANFVAYLSCIKSDDQGFNYSGAMLGWLYVSQALYEIDPFGYDVLYHRLPKEVKDDLRANDQFFEEHHIRLSKMAEQLNDAYLTSTGQEGVASYDQVTQWILQYEGENKSL